MNFMRTVQKVKKVKTEEIISGNDKEELGGISIYLNKFYLMTIK